MYKYVFGPVDSRRLGVSLGVDLVKHKICSLDCIYCESGKTTCLTIERKEYVPVKKVMEEIDDYFMKNPSPDFITFSGSGEPSLNSRIGDVINYIKQKYEVPVCVLTNGTLFYDPKVRKALMKADIVMPSLDSAVYSSFLKINRPHKSLSIENQILGISQFKKEFKGRMDLEIFILTGINDSKEDIDAFRKAIVKINPDNVVLNTLDRPGIASGLRSASRLELESIAEKLGHKNIQIVQKSKNIKKKMPYRKDREEAIFGTICRRPCTIDDLSNIFGIEKNILSDYLAQLEKEHKIEAVRMERGIFYQVTI